MIEHACDLIALIDHITYLLFQHQLLSFFMLLQGRLLKGATRFRALLGKIDIYFHFKAWRHTLFSAFSALFFHFSARLHTIAMYLAYYNDIGLIDMRETFDLISTRRFQLDWYSLFDTAYSAVKYRFGFHRRRFHLAASIYAFDMIFTTRGRGEETFLAGNSDFRYWFRRSIGLFSACRLRFQDGRFRFSLLAFLAFELASLPTTPAPSPADASRIFRSTSFLRRHNASAQLSFHAYHLLSFASLMIVCRLWQ